jgi:hypothetical protein
MLSFKKCFRLFRWPKTIAVVPSRLPPIAGATSSTSAYTHVLLSEHEYTARSSYLFRECAEAYLRQLNPDLYAECMAVGSPAAEIGDGFLSWCVHKMLGTTQPPQKTRWELVAFLATRACVDQVVSLPVATLTSLCRNAPNLRQGELRARRGALMMMKLRT